MRTEGMGERRLLSIADPDQLRRVLRYMLDEQEFLSPYGIRALSKRHREQPFCLVVNGSNQCISYEPGEATTGVFGGNSNWRGPIWMPVNYLIIESLYEFHRYYGDEFKVECPTGSGRYLSLREVAGELSRRLSRLFLRDEHGRRPVFGASRLHQEDPAFRDNVLFHEFFHGDTGRGLGASHQTGWSGLVALLLHPRTETTCSISLATSSTVRSSKSREGAPA
jgi:Glycosyl hydrolase family 63 C-terminal domain